MKNFGSLPKVLTVWVLSVGAAGATAQSLEVDHPLQREMDARRAVWEARLKDYVVPLALGADGRLPQIGLSLVSNTDRNMHLAYDTTAKGVVAVWQLSPPPRGDYRLDYQAGFSASGGARFTLLSRF